MQPLPAFTPAHRGGSGPPLVCIHGFMDTWRGWELVLPALERRFDVFAPTLPGHAGGPPLRDDELGEGVLADGVERAMDDAGIASAHVLGNSLGGYVALQLAARGRARSVVALAPAGGWPAADSSFDGLIERQLALLDQLRAAAPYVDAIVATPEGRRLVTEYLCVRYEHLSPAFVAQLVLGGAGCEWSAPQAMQALQHGWTLAAEKIACPLRIVWGSDDRLLPWPAAAERFRREWLPDADWVVLDGVGHCPQLDTPAETAALVVDFAL